MKIGTLTLARLLDDPVAEFRYCSRCDNDMPYTRVGETCSDCEGAAKYHPRGVQGKHLPPHNPAYEVSLHYDKHPKHCPTITTLEALDVTYMVYTAQRDSIEVEWAKQLFNPEWQPHITYPIVLISAHGQYVDHWAGFDRLALKRIPAARAAAINAQGSFVGRVPSRELVAA
jgi:hypothetical protein